MYLYSEKAISDLNSYKIIKEYLKNNNMLANNHGLYGILSEYYAYVRELDFLVKYRNFCIEYGINDTASGRIKEMAKACDEWGRASEEYVAFSKSKFDGSIYDELVMTNAITVLDKITQEYAAIDITSPETSGEGNSDVTEENSPAKKEYQVPEKQ